MTTKKLESSSSNGHITEEVAILKRLLDETAQQLVGEETFETIQELVSLSATDQYVELEKLVATISNDEMVVVARYFSILPLLINISEDVDLAYKVNYANNTDSDYLGKLSATIDTVSDKDNAKEILEHVNVVPVLTAHPTQVQRKTVLELTTQIHDLLRKYRDVQAGIVNREKWLDELRRYVEIIMQTDIIRERKLKVKNEITNVMEYYNVSLIKAITKLTTEYKKLASERGLTLDNPRPITMGMWIGGDRDGNPYVTAETLRMSATVQSEVILNYYIEKLTTLYRTFSLSTTLCQASDAVKEMAEHSNDTSVYRENEPYRKAFNYIQSKVIQTLIELKTDGIPKRTTTLGDVYTSTNNASVVARYVQDKLT